MRLKELAVFHHGRFNITSDVVNELKLACIANDDLASFDVIGRSRQGRKIYAFRIGNGPLTVSLVAGSHADEPVGAETIRTLIVEGLRHRADLRSYFDRCTFLLIPQINPDGELRNREWMQDWPSLESYLLHAVRELPGDDIEFGYPSMRPENEAAALFWKSYAPIDLHVSLHGMGFAEGVMLLIERHWTSRTQPVRDGYTKEAAVLGLGLHTHNRRGEKGFFYIEDGYTTTPEGAAMQAHFRGLGDNETAALFHQSSMEFMRDVSGDPLSLVTEIPLFALTRSGDESMVPENYLAFRDGLPELRQRLSRGLSADAEIEAYGLKTVPVQDAIGLQFAAIELGIEAVEKQRAVSNIVRDGSS